MRQYVKSLWSYNPIPGGCVLYLPLWHPSLKGSVFKSIDPFGHVCTVTEAIYGATGRTFDSVDDLISCGSASVLDNIFDGGGTVIAWINPTSDGELDNGRIITKFLGLVGWVFTVSDQAASKVKLKLFHYFGASGITPGEWITDTTQATIGVENFVALSHNADSVDNNPTIYQGTTVLTVGDGLTETLTPVGVRQTDAAANMIIGNVSITNTTFDGIIREVWAYNRILSAGEIEHIRINTIGRHG